MLTLAITIHPESEHSKYLYMANISESAEALQCYEKALRILMKKKDAVKHSAMVQANIYSAIAELYRTDLSQQPDASVKCK